jgi:arylsulfatase
VVRQGRDYLGKEVPTKEKTGVSSNFKGRIGRYYDDSEPWWASEEKAPAGAPNVVIVVLDDVGFAQFGCYGSDISTPTFDSLAEGGLRFTNFHTTAVCSATRACLMTGRNHHSNGMGRVIEVATGFPGYNAQIPRANGFLSEILGASGFNTYAVGKWHLTPEDDCHSAGKRNRWPLGRGFDRFYGFMGGETHQFVPSLIEDNHLVSPVDRLRPDYHLTEDLVDRAIGCIRDAIVIDPDKPFFLYLAPGACHSPHQAPAEWIDRYRGQFDEGWDVWRDRALAKQIAMGVMQPHVGLSPRPPWVPEWSGLSGDEQRLYARYMEAFAGFLSHTDDQIGRLTRFLSETGQLDNTVLMVLSDNGASSEGGPTGMVNLTWSRHPRRPTLEETLARIDEIGGPRCHTNYPWGWTMAGNTPFQRWKREVHEGGIADPLIVHWPDGFGRAGGLRRQYVHAIDVLPTVLELAGVAEPSEIDGVPQSPLEGVSFADLCRDPDAPSRRTTQYYEMFGNRALYHEGWKAVTQHPYMSEEVKSFDDDKWELYHVAEDVSERFDLAEERPDKLRELVERWWVEAGKYQVLPLDDRPISDFVTGRPSSVAPRATYVYLPGAAPVPEGVAVSLKNRSHAVIADVEVEAPGPASGVLLSQGSFLGGWSFYLDAGRLTYVHNLGSQELTYIRSTEVVAPGPHRLGFRFTRAEDDQGRGALLIDDRVVGEGDIVRFTPIRFSATGAGLTCGYSNGLPVSDEFEGPFRFSGVLKSVTVTVEGAPDFDAEGEARHAIASQ